MWKQLWRGVFGVPIALFPTIALAKGDELEGTVTALSLRLIILASFFVVGLLFLAVLLRRPSETIKRLLFWSIATTVAATTIALAGLTIWLNSISLSNGPIHWHTDYEVWACGQRLDLIDPVGRFANKVGSPSRHEHNDNRLHFEGVVVAREDATLTDFFQAMGVILTESSLVFPTNAGILQYQEGGACPDGKAGDVQIFAYTVNADQTFSQQKIDPRTFVMSPHSQVPPGDCVIVEVGPTRTLTDKLCTSYQVAQEIGKLKGEVYGSN